MGGMGHFYQDINADVMAFDGDGYEASSPGSIINPDFSVGRPKTSVCLNFVLTTRLVVCNYISFFKI